MTESTPSNAGRLPDFIVIGSMKSATTALFHYLRARPDVFMATPKEPNFFSIDDVHAQGADWYRGLFADAADEQLCGEASPSYTRAPRFPEAASRMAALLPDVKLIYTMRHPVNRFYSNYVFDRAYGFRDSIVETLRDRPYVLETSRYIDQIRRYTDYYPLEQMHFIVVDDLKQDPLQELNRLAAFLGIADFTPSEAAPRTSNEAGRQSVYRRGNGALRWGRSLPLAGVVKRLAPRGARAAVRNTLTTWLPESRLGGWLARRQTAQVEPLTEELRAELHRRLDDSTRELGEYLGRDLSPWLARGSVADEPAGLSLAAANPSNVVGGGA